MEVLVFFLEYILYYSFMSKLCFLMPFLSLFAFFIVLTVLVRFEVNALQPFLPCGLRVVRRELLQWKFPEYLRIWQYIVLSLFVRISKTG